METIQKEITEKEIILAASGFDSFGRPKSSVGFFLESQQDEKRIRCKELHVIKPKVSIFKNNYTQIDLTYKHSTDKDLDEQWKFLEEYTLPENSLSEADMLEKTIELIICIYPNEYNFKYYIMALNPILCCLTSEKPNSEEIILRIVFDNFNVFFLEADQKEIENNIQDYYLNYEHSNI